jgi:neutral ceramidase
MWLKNILTVGLGLIFCTGIAAFSQAADTSGWKAGAAGVDITPEYPVRLSGYGSRTTPHEGVEMRIHAKALALTWKDTAPAIILTVDNCGVPATIRAEVLKRLQADGLPLEDARFSLHSSHTHCAPALPGLLPFLFGSEPSKEEQAAISRYAEDLTGHLVTVIKEAFSKQEPAELHWSTGKVSFAMNRRLKTPKGYSNSPNPYGPVDHSLPVLRVTSKDGKKLRAIYSSYACHCTTLSINKIHSDWAGCAQKELQLRFPDVIAMTAIGCGADQNPYPRREMEHVERHGVALAKEAVRVINEPMKALQGPIICANKEVLLPFDTPHDRATWEQRAQDTNKWTARHAKHFLATLDRGEKIPDALPYMVQVWSFADDLLTINLPGEVVVDYSLRFKKDNDPDRTWVNSYTNDVPCYIPSQRVWEEGGYEAAGAMVYYGHPNRFASGVEEVISQAVQELVPEGFMKKRGKASK